jgi:hypothetical protein
MASLTESSTPSRVGRRVGYAIGALVNVALLVALNVWPGWDEVPFLTADFEQVLGLINLSLAVGFLTSVANVALDSFGAKALGDLATNVIGLVVSVRLLQVFPFDFSGGFDWSWIVRFLLVLGVIGSLFGAGAAVVRLLRGPRAKSPAPGWSPTPEA